MADDNFSLEDIQGWHTPKQVEDLLPDHWSKRLKREQIAHRMQAGTIRTGALRMVSEADEHHGVIINATMWERWGFLAEDGSAESFWEGASFQKFVPSRRGFSDQHLIQLFGVRLHPGDVSTMFLELGVSVSATSRPGMLAAALGSIATEHITRAPRAAPALGRPGKVDRSVLRDWIREFGKRNPDSPFGVILQNARLAFPQLHVAELPVKHAIAELGLKLSPGNRAFLRKTRRDGNAGPT